MKCFYLIEHGSCSYHGDLCKDDHPECNPNVSMREFEALLIILKGEGEELSVILA